MKIFFSCFLLLLLLLPGAPVLAQVNGIAALRLNRTTVSNLRLDPAPHSPEGRMYGFIYNWDTPYIPKKALGCKVLSAFLYFDNPSGKMLKRFDLKLGTGPTHGHVKRCLEQDFGKAWKAGTFWVWTLGGNQLIWNPEERTISFKVRSFVPQSSHIPSTQACENRFN